MFLDRTRELAVPRRVTNTSCCTRRPPMPPVNPGPVCFHSNRQIGTWPFRKPVEVVVGCDRGASVQILPPTRMDGPGTRVGSSPPATVSGREIRHVAGSGFRRGSLRSRPSEFAGWSGGMSGVLLLSSSGSRAAGQSGFPSDRPVACVFEALPESPAGSSTGHVRWRISRAGLLDFHGQTH